MDSNNEPPKPQAVTTTNVTKNVVQTKNMSNMIFAVVIILYQILTLPIYGVLFRLHNDFVLLQDYGGVLLMSMSTILLIVGFGLVNSYITRYSLSGMTYTLVIFALTIQHFFLFRAFWNKAGANDYNLSSKTFQTLYDSVSLSNYSVDRQLTSLLPSGPIVQAIAQAISLTIAFSSIAGRVGLLQTFILTLIGSILYEVNAQLIYRWFITDNGFGCRIFLFGSVLGLVIAIILGKRQTTVNHTYYQSDYRSMAFGLLGFLFVCIGLPSLSAISVFTRSAPDNAILYASHINAWFAVFSSVLGTFTASAFLYRKFSVFDLVFAGIAGTVSLAMEADICFNPCVPLIVGYVVGFGSSIYPSNMHRKANQNGVLFTFPILNNYLIPGFLACIVSAVVQACNVSENGPHIRNALQERTPIQQGGWQIVGFLITASIAALAGIIIGFLIKAVNRNETADQFNDQFTYSNTPSTTQVY